MPKYKNLWSIKQGMIHNTLSSKSSLKVLQTGFMVSCFIHYYSKEWRQKFKWGTGIEMSLFSDIFRSWLQFSF